MTIETPEGLVVTLPLAGVGSRFVSAAIDFTIQILLTAAAFTVFVGFGVGGGVGPGLFAISVFAVFFVYDVSFEVLAGGRTPGKRWTGLRVVRSGGQPVGFVASAIRNLLRLVDFLPSMYLVGIRTPWTLASEEVWIRTHRLGGKLMVAGGLLIIVAALLQSPEPDIRADTARCAPSHPKVIALLADLLHDLNRSVAKAAACALGRLGRSESRETLVRLLRDDPSSEVIDSVVAIAAKLDELLLVPLGERIAATASWPPPTFAGSPTGPTSRKTSCITSRRFTKKPESTRARSSSGACTSTTSASPRRAISSASPVPAATTLTL